MLNKISVSGLATLLGSKFGKQDWSKFEPETICLELDSFDAMLVEKFRVLQGFSSGVSQALESPEFVLWSAQVMNGEPASFDSIELPTSLELAWMIMESQKLAIIFGEKLEVPEEFKEVVWYVLNEEGWREPTSYFAPFIARSLAGQDQLADPKADSELKVQAIASYLNYMYKESKSV